MPFYGCTPSDSTSARARYRTLIVSAFCMACAVVVGVLSAAAQDVDVSSGTRLESVMALIRARDAKAGPELAARFDAEPQPGIRAWIVRGEGVLKAAEGPALFKKALGDTSAIVRLAAVDALAQTVGPSSVADLNAAMAVETSAGVRHTIASWLGTFKTAASRTALQQALTGDKDPNVRVQAARSLKQHGTGAARQALKAAKNDPDGRVRGIANEP